MTTECAICRERFEFDNPDQFFSVLIDGIFELVCDPCTDEIERAA